MRLRLASYNLHKCLGMDRRRKPARNAKAIAALKADIVALQEVDHRLGQRPAAMPQGLLERATGLRVLPFALEGPSLGWHGQTILVRPDLEPVALRRIVLPGLEPRGAILAELETRAGPLRVIGVHLGLVKRSRAMQLAAIRAAISHRPVMPTAILGDFNDWSASGCGEHLAPDFRLHAPGRTFPAPGPMGALDRIAVGFGLHLIDAGTLQAPPARIASDHLPIWADVWIGSPDA